MKIKDIVAESHAHKRGKPTKQTKKSSTGEWLFRDEGVDRTYNLNRIMMAAAKADGQSTRAVDVPSASWVEKYNVARPYTEHEHKMMQAAFKTIGGEHHHSINDHRSRETDDTHRHSAVPHNSGAKRNKPKN
jgi:hypothetical protein